MEFERNVELDAVMVRASMLGLFELFAIQYFETASEAWARAEWLKKQPEEYIMQVSDLVEEQERMALWAPYSVYLKALGEEPDDEAR